MTPAVLAFTVAAMLGASGIVFFVAASRGYGADPTPRPGRRALPALSRRHGVAVGVGVLTLLLTRWPVAGLAAAGAVLYVPKVLGGGKAAREAIARSEALAEWTRGLAAAVSGASGGSVVATLERSLATAPAPIAHHVAALVRRLGPQGPEAALRQFARDVDDTAADKIAMLLILRERNGGPGLKDGLAALAKNLANRTRQLREVEAERAKPRSSMRTVITVFLVLAAGMSVFAHGYLSSYGTVEGQAGLVLVVAVFGYALRWMRRLSDPVPQIRVLTDRIPDQKAEV